MEEQGGGGQKGHRMCRKGIVMRQLEEKMIEKARVGGYMQFLWT